MLKNTNPIFSVWPNILLTICVCLTFAALSWFATYDYRTDEQNRHSIVVHLKLEEVRSKLDLLSDLLTANSALIAQTGDDRWIGDYKEDKDEWVKILKENPDIQASIAILSDSLLETEDSVIAFAKQKNLKDAQRFINSPTYQSQEERLDKRLDEIKLMQSRLQQNNMSEINASNSERLHVLWVIIILACFIWVLGFILINLYRKTVARYAREIISRNALLETSNAELKTINTELNSFVYAASHQLSGPMKSIKGLVAAFDKGKGSVPLEEFIDMLETTVDKIDANLKSIIFYSENRRSDVVETEFQFEPLLHEVLLFIESEIDMRDITIKTNIENCTTIYTDQNRLKVILICLILNAVQYQKEDNPSKEIAISGECTETTLELIIEDNGIGIPKDKVVTVFDMFTKLNHNSSGPGLGLYIVTEILKKLGGSISLASNSENGITAKIILPI